MFDSSGPEKEILLASAVVVLLLLFGIGCGRRGGAETGLIAADFLAVWWWLEERWVMW